MVVRVCERAAAARTVSRVLVATDDARIRDAVEAEGFECRMTSAAHETGTDRLAEVAATLEADLVVNVQGDEPLLAPSTIDAAVEALAANERAVMSTISEPIDDPLSLVDPNVVKVVARADGRALYFSRAGIPFPRDVGFEGIPLPLEELAHCRRHIGLYVYRRDFLLDLAGMPQTPLERIERLEQLRPLAAGLAMGVAAIDERPAPGIDTEDDLARANAAWETYFAGRS